MKDKQKIVVIGGGAAGFFAAIAAAELNPDAHVILVEKMRQVLAKVRISGGGRCNVTQACFEPSLLINHYPRGGKELRNAFARFQPRDTVAWFESRGVSLKTENDGRMFPTSDSSETIIQCLMQKTCQHHVDLRVETGVVDCKREDTHFSLMLGNGDLLKCHRLIVATGGGGTSKVSVWLEKLGHSFVPSVPSLFTFNIPNSPLLALAGVSVPHVKLALEGSGLSQSGPMLITHWGFSGPAVLKLSAWAARYLYEKGYSAILKVNWLPDTREEELMNLLNTCREKHAARLIIGECPLKLPKNLWKSLLEMANIPAELRWSMFSKQNMKALIQILTTGAFQIKGKSTNKDEFVTCGGIKLSEVDFKTMESRICPGLFFAGEILDVDGVTGGYNFQNAWTTGWLAGRAAAQHI